MAKKTKPTRLQDAEIPEGTPERAPKKGKRSCDSCAVVGPKATVQLCLRRTGKPPVGYVSNASGVCSLMRGLETNDRESFWALHLNARHEIVDIDKIAVGGQSGVEVHPREVFKSALLSGAESLIFVHNHPSGNSTASAVDVDLTRRLKSVGELVGIKVLDHIVIGQTPSGDADCHSMAMKGLMGENTDGEYPLLANKRKKG